jgi:hypothetical protein
MNMIRNYLIPEIWMVLLILGARKILMVHFLTHLVVPICQKRLPKTNAVDRVKKNRTTL